MSDRASTEGLPLREGHIVVTLPSGEQYYDPPIPDRASAEGLRARIESLIDDDEAAYVSVALIRAALRDTGPRPDSDCLEIIDMWRERALRAEDALTLRDGHPHDGYAYGGCQCVCCVNVRALSTPRTETSDDA